MITIIFRKFAGELVRVSRMGCVTLFQDRLSSLGRDSCLGKFLRALKDMGATGK